jgi:hypothetical protein
MGSRLNVLSWFELSANLARLMLCTVHVDVEISALEAPVLSFGYLSSRWHLPGSVRAFFQRDDGRSALAGRSDVNMCSRSLYAGSFDFAADCPVSADLDLAGAGRRGRESVLPMPRPRAGGAGFCQ